MVPLSTTSLRGTGWASLGAIDPEPKQRLWLHWPEEQETFVLNAKHSRGTPASQFLTHWVPLLPPSRSLLYSVLGVKLLMTVAAAPIVIRPACHHCTLDLVFFWPFTFVGSYCLPPNNESVVPLIYSPLFFSLVHFLHGTIWIVTPHVTLNNSLSFSPFPTYHLDI
jgi:hypothetical protein